ncbi:MarR family transcriptional regulator [Bacillus sp. FJAT-49736]|uniref:MarR family winged helix-turn-helix transcriptional regulator n=1 Tax=Bacillus sp. FJAT-49736 TaxID=2833582 RepID=UPI001BC96912|nr:MarR family transcriptional regulator [Bacillus sp. FJAT-49736]MBS4173078.1 MarR family transcriptional regulator [Bacillus sp. FJAT-49736]
MGTIENDAIGRIEMEIVTLLRRADFKRTLDGEKNSLDRSGYLILHTLLEEGSKTIRSLSDIFQLNISTMSRQIQALESKGHIERNSDTSDGRVNFISISVSGKNALLKAKKVRRATYEEILSDWKEDEKDIFAELITKLNRKIETMRRIQS